MFFCFSGAMLVGCRMPPSADEVQCAVVCMFRTDASCGASLVSVVLPRASLVWGDLARCAGFFEEDEDTRRCFIAPSIPPILVPFPDCCIGAPEGRRGVKAFIVGSKTISPFTETHSFTPMPRVEFFTQSASRRGGRSRGGWS